MDNKKFASGVKATGEILANNKKPILIIGASIAVVFIGISIVRGVSKGFGSIFDVGGKFKGSGDFTQQPVDSTRLTISQTMAKNFAEQLYEAMRYGGPIYGTDKAAIEAVFNKLNSEDFKMVYNAFGRRSYSHTGVTPSKIEVFLGFYSDLDLVQWLVNELDGFDSALKNKIRPIITNAGFAFAG